ncbi:putative cysteine desulfurase [Pirellulimonas nuda]|uniref:Putative cysteine desulfurase n=1 Tax=Pirellulimonas nuda TaxID=2528009 RepID=A0A518D8H0_9BACT|nr:aminotransferase class V-fold PLP-dependent enzyme [Pirellulimonas nuda]QDU87740.1 putative cysteine desulfurase [Pirellulimonas nuda]
MFVIDWGWRMLEVDNATLESTRAALRAQMPITERWAYFDHAAVAPLPRPTMQAIQEWTTQAGEQGDTAWPAWAKQAEATRRDAAALIGADPGEIALVANTTAGINLVAEGIDWREGDNLVLPADEYPSNQYPWLNQAWRGVEVRTLPTDRGRVDLSALRDACDARTRIVSMSWVQFSAGYRHDIDAAVEIAHAAGAWFFLDAIQGLGVFPLDVRSTPVDFLAADGHKWMLGPEGAGMAYIRRDRLEQLRPVGVGAHSVKHAHDYTRIDMDLRDTAARYEGGSMNMPGMLGFGASLALLRSLPAGAAAACVLDITDYAVERLQSSGAQIVSHRTPEDGRDPRSGIVSFELPGRDPMEFRSGCLEAGVVLSCRAGRLRIAPHAYTNREDVDRLISML